MIETAHIDIKAVIERLSCIDWKTDSIVRGHREIHGSPCPFCGQGTDRFAVFVEGEKPHFYCGIHGNGCGAHGDVIAFVQQIKGYTSAGQAIRELREMGYPVGDETIASNYRPPSERDRPAQKWQDQGNTVMHAAQKYLWSQVGVKALDYLRMRGLWDETIKRFRLGYWPKWTEYKLTDWGLEEEKTFWLRPSILIPCYEKDVLWGINRRLTSYTEKELERQRQGEKLPPRYMQIKGSSNGLFNVGDIRPEEPLFMTEGEVDAMTLTQETGYAVVATGSTKGAQLSRWVASLSLASHILVSFDNDEGKGEKAAEYWTDLFEDNATFYPPWSKDVNEMLQQGQDIKLWASMGAEIACSQAIQDTGRTLDYSGITPDAVVNQDTTKTLPVDSNDHDSPELVQDEKQQKTTKNNNEIDSNEHLSSTVGRNTDEKLVVSRGFSWLDTLAPLPDHDAPDRVGELPDTCTACGSAEIEGYSATGQPYCAEHLPRAEWGQRKQELIAAERERLRMERHKKAMSGSKWIVDPEARWRLSEQEWATMPKGKGWQLMVDDAHAVLYEDAKLVCRCGGPRKIGHKLCWSCKQEESIA
jgi:hypothetical protein